MRPTAVLLFVSLAACSSVSESIAQDVGAPPDTAAILKGLKSAAADSHFDQPIEVTDLISANPNSSSPWLICLRSAKSEESKRIAYSAFFTDKYVSSRYSSMMDPCQGQVYHPFKAD
jgi:hypothetical protein